MTDETAGLGHNNSDDYAILIDRVDMLVGEANRALNQFKEIDSEDLAGRFDDFERKLSAELKAVDAARKVEKDPHDEAIKEIQGRYKPLADRLDTAKRLVKGLLTKWLIKKDDARKAEAKRKEDEAYAAIRAAEEAKRKAEASAGDVVGNAVAAEEAKRKADEAVKAAEQAASSRTQVKGDNAPRARALRTTWKAKIEDQDKVYAHFRQHPDVIETLQRLVNADARSNGDKMNVPGAEPYEEKAAA